MKKLTLWIMLAILPILSYTQMGDDLVLDIMDVKVEETLKPNINLNMSVGGYDRGYSKVRTGPLLMLGGGAFILASALTVPNYYVNGVRQHSPYAKTTPRFMAMVGGIVTFSSGVIITIAGG